MTAVPDSDRPQPAGTVESPSRSADPQRHRVDGSAGDADYARIGTGYISYRRPEPAFMTAIQDELGPAATVLNVGAGAGSYEPTNRQVTAVEPSATMRRQRPTHLSEAIDATAEHLPFGDDAFEAAMATFTVHQWSDLAAGLAEVRRVTRGPVLVLTCDPASLEASWLNRYAPEVIATEARRYPAIQDIARLLSTPIPRPPHQTHPGAVSHQVEEQVRVRALDIPWGCVDGFSEAYSGRPELLLDPGARLANSAWSFVGPDVEQRFEQSLRADLDSGAWDEEFGYLRHQLFYDGSLRLIIADGQRHRDAPAPADGTGGSTR